MGLIAFTAPILPGKVEEWEQWTAELLGPRQAEYQEHRRRLGLKKEMAFLHRTLMGDFAIIVQEVDNHEEFMRKLAASDAPFDVWFNDRVRELHGLSASVPPLPPPPELKILLG